MSAGEWALWVDTGGTFTDCLALDPSGKLHRAKVLSSGALRARVASVRGREVELETAWEARAGVLEGAMWVGLGGGGRGESPRVVAHPSAGRIRLDQDPGDRPGDLATLQFDVEAPILAARLITGTPSRDPLPPLQLRIATTRGTNALLERRGARVALFVTEGFGDLLEIGNQQRPDLFALDIRRPRPLWDAVVEVPGRLDAEGVVVRPFDPAALRTAALDLHARGFEVAAVALMHSWRAPEIEAEVAEVLEDVGFRFVSRSASLSPVIGIEDRARTAVVDAYLSPTIEGYLGRIQRSVHTGTLRVMTSAGGLVDAGSYHARDSLLSGPAGGVVGAAAAARAAGLERIIAFDMGGTSTDVSRWAGDFDYRFRTQVGDATITAPALAIETVAAGGGSICAVDTGVLHVGPRSAGADPGPACYGAGGPLTLTDVNLLLGRLIPGRFGLPLDLEAAESRLSEVLRGLEEAGRPLDRETVLSGFLQIADERMAEAVRRVSVRWGHDPRSHALVAFGGAGGQHACAVAHILGMQRVLLPPEAGLLSALGLGMAVIERFEERQVLRDLDEIEGDLPGLLRELKERAAARVIADGVDPGDAHLRRSMVFLRLRGQESTLQVEVPLEGPPPDLRGCFERRYVEQFGYQAANRPVEVESVRVVVSSKPRAQPAVSKVNPSRGLAARAWFDEDWQQVPVIDRDGLSEEAPGPLLVVDPHALLVVPRGWTARRLPSSAVLASWKG